MKWSVIAGFAAVLLLTAPAPAGAMEELTEGELGEITAGAASAQLVDGVLQFQFAKETAGGRYIEGSGSVARYAEPLSGGAGSYLIVSDNAQSNLSSFITVNAVNSAVTLLVNLNININSIIGSVGQTNTGGLQP